MDSIVDREPIDRVARRVADQRGCADKLSSEQLRENLVKKLKALKQRHTSLKKGDAEKKMLGFEIYKLQTEIGRIRPKRKTPELNKYIVDVIKEEVSGCEFKRIYDKAFLRMQEDGK